MRNRIARLTLASALCLGCFSYGQTLENQQPAPQTPAVRKVGTVKSIGGNTLVLKADSGEDIEIVVQDATPLKRMPPGQTDMKAATPIAFKDLQVGDRMFVRGASGSGGQSLQASAIVVMKQADVAQKQQHDLQDWQRRGIGGIVSALDAAAGEIAIAITPSYSVKIKTSKSTAFLRYAENSVKFADAQKGTLDQIKTGDQLRARGNRSENGKEFAAEEIISGSFRNIAGTIRSIDAGAGSLSVMDLLSKKPVQVLVTSDTQLRKLPAPMAQRVAMLLKGPPSGSSGGGPSGGGPPANGAPPAGTAPAEGRPPGGAPGGRPGGPPDLQQMLGRVPSVTLADLQKGDAVLIVSTQGTGASAVTAITLLGGVEPVLTASPNGSGAATLLSGWNMSAALGGGEGGGAPQ